MGKISLKGSAIGRTGLVAACLALSLGACASDNLQSTTAQAVNRSLENGYRVSAGDKLKVTVFDEANLTGEYLVNVNGELAMPLIGSIDVRNRTTSDLAGIISTKLQEGAYVLSPNVSVEIVTYRPFYILGEVNRPGEYAHQAGMTLDQAIAKAGGYTRRAETGAVVLKRPDWSKSMRVKLDGTAVEIAPGDTIRVQEVFF